MSIGWCARRGARVPPRAGCGAGAGFAAAAVVVARAADRARGACTRRWHGASRTARWRTAQERWAHASTRARAPCGRATPAPPRRPTHHPHAHAARAGGGGERARGFAPMIRPRLLQRCDAAAALVAAGASPSFRSCGMGENFKLQTPHWMIWTLAGAPSLALHLGHSTTVTCDMAPRPRCCSGSVGVGVGVGSARLGRGAQLNSITVYRHRPSAARVVPARSSPLRRRAASSLAFLPLWLKGERRIRDRRTTACLPARCWLRPAVIDAS